MRKRLATALAAALVASWAAQAAAVPIERSGDTLVRGGQPVTLVGYGCYGILTESDFDYETYFGALQSYGINFVRVWGNYHWTNDLIPFVGTRNNADLTKLSDPYFARLGALVAAAEAHDIIVLFTLWDSVCLEGAADSGNRWVNCPYRSGNNAQSYCAAPTDFDDVPPDSDPPIWTQSHLPYMTRVVATLGDRDNVIYEIMNEPYPGYGDQTFHDTAIDALYGLLHQPQHVGSKLIATNDGPLSNAGNPKVDLVSYHAHDPGQADDHNGLQRPVVISNDGDASQSSTSLPGAAERAARVLAFAKGALGSGAAKGHNHLEILDKDIYGASWGGQDYDPKVGNITHSILETLAPFAGGLPQMECPKYDHIIDDQDGAPQFVLTGDDWGSWGSNGCGFSIADSSFKYLTKTTGGPDKKGTATWSPDLPAAGTYEITTWWRKTGNRTTDADHFIYDGVGGVTHVIIDQKADSPAEGEEAPGWDCKSGWVSLGTYTCAAGVGGCKVVLDGTDDDQSDEANAVRFRLVDCNGSVTPPAAPTCEFPGEGPHTVKAFAEQVTGTGWEQAALAEGEPDGAEAHSPNVDAGEHLAATFGALCDPDGEETITAVRIGVKLRTQYDSGKYDVLLSFHGGGAAQLITHHTAAAWDVLDVTPDQPDWTWGLIGAIEARLELDSHPGGAIDSDAWVDAFSLEVDYVTEPADCTGDATRCDGPTLQRCEGFAWKTVSKCPYGCTDGACLESPEGGEDAGPVGSDAASAADTSSSLPPSGVDAAQGGGGSSPVDGSPSGGLDAQAPGGWSGFGEGSTPCEPGARRCDGSVALACSLDGRQWVAFDDCGAPGRCTGGACTSADDSGGCQTSGARPARASLLLALLLLARALVPMGRRRAQ